MAPVEAPAPRPQAAAGGTVRARGPPERISIRLNRKRALSTFLDYSLAEFFAETGHVIGRQISAFVVQLRGAESQFGERCPMLAGRGRRNQADRRRQLAAPDREQRGENAAGDVLRAQHGEKKLRQFHWHVRGY